MLSKSLCAAVILCSAVIGLAFAAPPGTLVTAQWPSAYETRTAQAVFPSPSNRNDDVTVVAHVNFPSGISQPDGTVFEAGCGGAGTFIGIKNNNFVVAAGEGTGTATDDHTVVLTIPLSDARIVNKFDGQLHEIAVNYRVNAGAIALHIDGTYIGKEKTTGGLPLYSETSPLWSGGNDGGFGTSNGCTTHAVDVTAPWPGSWSANSLLRFYLTSAGMTPAPLALTPPGTIVDGSFPAPYYTTAEWREELPGLENRNIAVAVVLHATLPTPGQFADGTLFESGCNGAGTFIGIEGSEFVVVGGKGGVTPNTDSFTTVSRIPLTDPRIASYFDGGLHEVAVKYWPLEGKMDVHFDGAWVSREAAPSGALHDDQTPLWSGSDEGGFGSSNGCTNNAVTVTAPWPVGITGHLQLFVLSGTAPSTPSPQRPPITCDGDCMNFKCAGGALRTTADGMTTLLLEGTTTGTLWGSVYYSSDSHVAAAAVHAGVLNVGETKRVRVQCVGTRPTLASAAKNGVTSVAWPSAWQAFTFPDDAAHATPLSYSSPVSPIGAYHRTDSGQTALIIDLVAQGFAEGDTVEIEMLGDYSYIGRPNEGIMVGAFTTTNAPYPSSALLTTLPQFSTTAGCTQCDIANDFAIAYALPTRNSNPPDFRSRVTTIPTGAKFLLVALFDDAYGDNTATDNDLGVKITRSGVPPSPPAPAEVCYHWFCAMSKCFAKGQQFDLVVTGIATSTQAIYGSSVYTDDSDIRLAAVHSSVLEVGETATITVMCYGAHEAYASETRHGISSVSWGYWQHSWALAKKE